MCGICGFIDLKNQRRIHTTVVQNMIDRLQHRGPDDTGCFCEENVAMGFTRLSIVDIQRGHQPLQNEDNSITLICNGEIFNYRDLKADLDLRGHIFKTRCDVEVIIHLYEEYGLDFIDDLNGQFAFALYDRKKNLLLCARDHAGIAPFFYTEVNGFFIFASEIKAILEFPGVKREVDITGLDQIFNFPGMVSPRTLFKNIKSLEGGCYLLINGDRDIRHGEYWDLVYPKDGEIDYKKDENYYIEILDDLLTKAVKARLQSDVPVGFYISGGIDSSIIAAKLYGLDIKEQRHSFSINFTDRIISEAKFQRLMAGKVNSVHHELLFDFSDISRRLRKAIYHSESALKETYNTASLALSESVRENNIKVILTGEGADELFGGYVGYRFDQLRQYQQASTDEVTSYENKVRKQLWGDENFLYEKNHYAYSNIIRELYSDDINCIYDEVGCLNNPIVKHDRIKGIDVFHKRSYIDFKLRMSDHLLSDHGDRMVFANSVEARYPFLDKSIMEFAVTAPVSVKLKNLTEKYILKKVAGDIVPKEIINRPKFAFVAPGSPHLLKTDKEFIGDLLSYNLIKSQGFFNPKTVEKLKTQYMEDGFRLNVPYDNDLLITVITFGIFLQEFKINT